MAQPRNPKRKGARVQLDTGGEGPGESSAAASINVHVLNQEKNTPELEEDDGDKPLEFRRKARVWALYLEDAEREAREIVDVWRTGLDSLLIFVGLFAGIVSAFIIDARNDLEVDSEQNLLSDIRDALRQPSIATVIHISASAKWINILWLLSLQITLFSAVMGVLAKEWLAKFAPATTRREAAEACHRFKLDLQVKLWRVEFVITLVPLLVQIASFLFSVGLIIRCLADDRTVGSILLAFFMAGGAVYLVVSLLPMIVPSSPFNTPLSSVFTGVKKAFEVWRSWDRMSSTDLQANRDDNEVLGQILYTKLILSHKPEHIDEAAAEIALPSFKPKWIGFLCKHENETPRHLLSRFKRCATTRTDNVTQRNATLRNHLLAFLQFVDHFAKELGHHKEPRERDELIEQYPVLLKTLQKSLEPTHPIHRWNNLHEALTPLLFGLRAQVLILLQSIPQGYRLTADYIPPIFDFEHSEMLDRPWELAFQDVRSQDRLYLMLSACRGVLQGEKNLRTISATILSLRLAQAGCLAAETDRTSEWGGAVKKEDRLSAEQFVQTFLLRLFKVIVTSWDDMACVELQTPSSSANGRGAPSTTAGERVLEILVSTLTHPNRDVRVQAIATLVAKQAQPERLNYKLFTYASIESVSKMVVYEDEDNARECALHLLANLVEDDKAKTSDVTTALIQSCKSGFKQGSPQQMRAMDFVRSLQDGLKVPFCSIIGDIIPELVDLAWDTAKAEIRWAAMNLVNDLWMNHKLELALTIRDAFIKTVNAKMDSHHDSGKSQRYQLLTILRDLLNKGESEKLPATAWGTQDFLQGVLATLFEEIANIAIEDSDQSVREEAKQLLVQLVGNGRLKGHLTTDVLGWLTASESSTWQVRNNAAIVSEAFVEQLDHGVELLNKLIDWAGKDDDIHVRRSSLRLVSAICSRKELNVEMIDALKIAIASVKESVVHDFSFMRVAWTVFLRNLIKLHPLFSDTMQTMLDLGAIDSDFDLLDLGWPESKEGALQLGRSESEYAEAMETTLPQTLTLTLSLQDVGSFLSQLPKVLESVKFLFCLSQIARLRGTAEKFLKQIATAIANDVRGIQETLDSFPKAALSSRLIEVPRSQRVKWIYIVAQIAAAGYYFEIAANIFQITVDDDDEDVQLACFRSLIYLAKSHLATAHALRLKQDTADRTDILLDENVSDPRVRIAFIQLLSALGRHEQCHPSLEVSEKLARSALSDCEQDVRVEAFSVISDLVRKNQEYRESVKNVIKFEDFEREITSLDSRVRRAWIRFASTQTEDADSPFLSRLLEKSFDDAESTVRSEAIQASRLLLESEDARLKEYVVDKLGRALSSSLAAPDSADRVVLTLAAITSSSTDPELQVDTARVLCQDQGAIWIELVLLLGQIPECKSFADKIIEAALENKRHCSNLDDLLRRSKLPDPIGIILPRALDLALDLESAAKPSLAVRVAAIRFFSHLKGLQCSGDCKCGEQPNESLAKNFDDAKVITRLADMAIKGDDADLRQRALQLLKRAFAARDPLSHLRRSIKTSLQRVIESSLQDHESEFRPNVLEVINNLTSGDGKDRFRGFFLPSIPHLLKTVLIDGDENLHKTVETILFENLSLPKESKLVQDVLVAIPPLVANITTKAGKDTALRLTETLSTSDDTASFMAGNLSQMLRNTSPFARATALELLQILYRKHGGSKPLLIDSAIPEITALALDDKNICTPAIHLLIALSSPPPQIERAPRVRERRNSTRTTSHEFVQVVSQIKPQVTKFMILLEFEDTWPQVAKLLSLVSLDATVRQAISLCLASKVFTLGSTKLQEGHFELLARLISDGRFQDEPTDYMMLFLAHALVPTNPGYSRYRVKILTALWSQYGSKSLQKNSAFDKLCKWFNLALFGRHATLHEVTAWTTQCGSWLGDEVVASPTDVEANENPIR